jgi:hypothetical protein
VPSQSGWEHDNVGNVFSHPASIDLGGGGLTAFPVVSRNGTYSSYSDDQDNILQTFVLSDTGNTGNQTTGNATYVQNSPVALTLNSSANWNFALEAATVSPVAPVSSHIQAQTQESWQNSLSEQKIPHENLSCLLPPAPSLYGCRQPNCALTFTTWRQLWYVDIILVKIFVI